MNGEYIYGDILFVINFGMDIFSLFITGKVFHLKVVPLRIISGASLGALYGVASLFINVGSILSGILGFFVVAITCLIAYKPSGAKLFMLNVLLTYSIGMLLGGLMTYMFSNFGKYSAYINLNGSFESVLGTIPLGWFLVFASISSLITYLVSRIIASSKSISNCLVKVSIFGTKSEFSCLVDTGNMLCDGITGTPVIFIKSNKAKFLPDEILVMKEAVLKSGNPMIDAKIRLIPMSTVNGTGIAVAFRPEKLEICSQANKNIYVCKEALLAVDSTPGDYGGYDGLCPSVLT